MGMIVFHGAWDLHALGLSFHDPSGTLGWRIFGHIVASAFLLLSGLSLILARQRGRSNRAILGRLSLVALAALAVTVATALWAPNQVVLFGILHCIALGDCLALALLTVPVWIVACLAVAAAVAPVFGAGSLPQGIWWLGLSTSVPDTLDYRPLLPWLSPILIGLLVGRWLGPRENQTKQRARPALRPLAWIGRHSLLTYLLHQPVLLAVLMPLAWALGPAPPMQPEQARTFLEGCEATCSAGGGTVELCRSTCHCALTATLKSDPPPTPEALAAACTPGTRR